MPMIVTDKGADQILKAYFNDSWPASKDLTINLFVNDYDPTETSELADFVIADGGGYAAKVLSCGSWTVTPANDPSDAIYAEQVWTFTGPLTGLASVYGYVVTDADSIVVFAEKLGTGFPFQPLLNGDTISVTPKFQASKGTPA